MVPSAVFCLVVVAGISRAFAAVTNEDIRVAILQIVNVVRSTDDKLERHEYRNRAVGEQLKKGLINIDKRIKMLDPLKGTVGRLDERLAAVETILMQKNEREKIQLQRTYEAVIDIQKNLPVVIEEMKNDILTKITMQEPPAQMIEPVISKNDFEKMEKGVMDKIDKVAKSIENIEKEVSKLKEDGKQVKDIHNKSTDNLETLKTHINDNQQLLTKYEKKLAEYNNSIHVPNAKEQDEWKKNVLKALDNQKSSVKDIIHEIKSVQNQVKQLPQKEILNKLSNLSNFQDPAIKQILKSFIDQFNKSHSETTKGLTGLLDKLSKNFANTNTALNDTIANVKQIIKDNTNFEKQIKQLPQEDSLKKLLNPSNFQDPTVRNTLNKISTDLNNTHEHVLKNINALTESLKKSFANTNSALDTQKTNTKEISTDLKSLQNQIKQLPQNNDTQRNANKLESLITSTCQDTSKEFIKQTLNNVMVNVNRSHDDTMKNIDGLTKLMATLIKDSDSTNIALDTQIGNAKEISGDLKHLMNQIKQLPQKNDTQRNADKLESIITSTCQDTSEEFLKQTLNNIMVNVNNSRADTTKHIAVMTKLMATFFESSHHTNNALNTQKANNKEISEDLKNLRNQIKQLPQKNDTQRNADKLESLITSTCDNSREFILQTYSVMVNVNKSRGDTMKNIHVMTKLMATLIENSENTNKALDTQKTNTKEMSTDLKNLQHQIKQLPQKNDTQLNANKLESLVTSTCQDTSKEFIKQTLNNVLVNVNKSNDDTMKNIDGLTKLMATLIKSSENTNNALDRQCNNANETLSDLKSLQNQIERLPQKEDVQRSTNKLESLISSNRQDPSMDHMKNALNEIAWKVNRGQNDTMQNFDGLTKLLGNLMKNSENTNNGLDTQKSNLKDILQDIKNMQTQQQQQPYKDVVLSQNAILTKLEDAMKNINGLSGITATLMKSFANTNDALDTQKTDIKNILRDLTSLVDKIQELPKKENILIAQEIVLSKLEEINHAFDATKQNLNEMTGNVDKHQAYVARNFDNLNNATATLTQKIANGDHKFDIQNISISLKNIQHKIDQLQQKDDICSQNETLQELGKLSTKISVCQDRYNTAISKILDVNDSINKTHKDTTEKLNDLSEITVTLGESFVINYEKIRTEIQGLNRLDEVMIKTADSVIDTKRRVEFGVHQILTELSKHSKDTAKIIQQAISDRLDIFEQSLLDDETGALANVTTKIEEDIHQVWRQIGIMYQQMSSDSEALKQLQNQTDAYITGSLGTIDNVKGKVGQITGRITEVDENLNYLLGRLSLITQEFNRIKSGLSSALDQIKESFHAVQKKIDKGPGPHKIENDAEVPAE